MKFSISAIKSDESGEKCEIAIGDFKETTPLFTDFWSASTYEAQWKGALLSLASGAVQRCILVIDIRPPSISAGIVFWALFREGEKVFLQQRFLRERDVSLISSPLAIEKQIAPRIQGAAEEQARVSEWELSFSDFIIGVEFQWA